jgi:predicted nucleotidyltransferase
MLEDVKPRIVAQLRATIPRLLAVYAFGSRVQGSVRADSDLDLAVLVEGYAEPLKLWEVAGSLADISGCAVDLLDLRAASTVMQHQILVSGQRWWSMDYRAELYEVAVLNEKFALDEARGGLLEDIAQRGQVYDR